MDKPERDELIELAQSTLGERWCLHPNGTSVWTGEEYEPDPDCGAPQYVVCQAPLPLNETEVRRMEFIAACSPARLLELLEFYGLSETRHEQGPEDADEVCAVCGYSTDGHTHKECFEHGKLDGALDENIRCAELLASALGIEYNGEHFEQMLSGVIRRLK